MIVSTTIVRRRRFRQNLMRTGIWALIFLWPGAGRGDAFEQLSSVAPVRVVRIGLAAHDVDGLWSGSSRESGPDFRAEVIFNRSLFHLLSAVARPNLGISLNTQGDTSDVHGGFLLQWESAWPIIFSTGLGLALHNGERDSDSADRKSLGSQVLFRIPIEIGYAVDRHHRFVLAFDHMSNAGLASPNQGLDTLGLVYAFQF